MPDINIIIAEDDTKIAEIQNRFVQKMDGFEVVGIANTISEAKDLIDVFQPDLVLLDIAFPDGNGIDLLWQIRQQYKNIDVILITAAKEVQALQDAIRGGAFDFILKPMVFNRFQSTLLSFQQQKNTLDTLKNLEQEDVDQLIRPPVKMAFEGTKVPKGIDKLTLQKVREVALQLDKQGISAEAVGEQIGISRTTARRYLEFLVSQGVVKPHLEYGSVGRPERSYFRVY